MFFLSQEGEEITDVLQNATRSLDDMRVSMTEIWMFFCEWYRFGGEVDMRKFAV